MTSTVSQQAPSLKKEGHEQICSLYMPPVPHRLLGAKNQAIAEWNTRMLPANGGQLSSGTSELGASNWGSLAHRESGKPALANVAVEYNHQALPHA